MEKILMLKNPITIHASLHAAVEMRIHGPDFVAKWAARCVALKDRGHTINTPHIPDDGSDATMSVDPRIRRVRMEGTGKNTLDGKFYSPVIDADRCEADKTWTVFCPTEQFAVAPDGSIYNCQAKLWSQRGEPMGNIQTYDQDEIGDFIECSECGHCHPCCPKKDVRRKA